VSGYNDALLSHVTRSRYGDWSRCRTVSCDAPLGLLLAFGVAAMPSETGEHYYFEIMLPGSIVGAIVGYATQKFGVVSARPARA
jgi:hypothetical protein